MPQVLHRTALNETTEVLVASGTIRLSFASELPVLRKDGGGKQYWEILSHAPGDANLGLINRAGIVLQNHDEKCEIGDVVRNSVAIGADMKTRGDICLADEGWKNRAKTDWSKIPVSVGYVHLSCVSETMGADSTPVRRMAWRPFEVSLLTVEAADDSVGINRAKLPSDEPEKIDFSKLTSADIAALTNEQKEKMKRLLLDKATEGGGGIAAAAIVAPAVVPPIVTPAIVRSADEIRKERNKEIGEIFAIGKQFNLMDEAQAAIAAETSVPAFRKQIMDGMKSGATPPVLARAENVSPGEFVVNSEAFKKFVSMRGQRSMAFDIPVNFRTTGNPATTTGLTSIQKEPGIVTLGVQAPRVADLIPQTATSATTIRYLRENSLTLAATAVAENGQKPEATWDLTEVDAGVKKIAVIGRVTDEFFNDYDATRDYINSRLAYMVQIQEDNQLLNADGASNKITGLLQTSGIQTEAQAGDTAADAIMKAMTKIRVTGFFEPDGIIMHPNDLQNLRLTKDKNGQYYWNGPFGGAYGTPGVPQLPSVWSLPVIWTTQIAAGTCLVGAYRLGAQIFRKMGLTIETTNSDASDFQYNRIAIRAEERLTLAVYRPLAFCTVTGLS